MRILLATLVSAVALSAADPTFVNDVQPILQAKCVACHGSTPQGKLDLRTQESLLKGGNAGPVVTPGSVEKSLLMTKVVTKQMPPGNVKLSDAEIKTLRVWIEQTLPAQAAASAPAVKEHEVNAILQARCVRCHGGLEQRAGLDLRDGELPFDPRRDRRARPTARQSAGRVVVQRDGRGGGDGIGIEKTQERLRCGLAR